MQMCQFCGATIDHAAAEASATFTARISEACSDASYLRVMAWALLAFFLVLFVPFMGLLGIAGLWFLRIAIPVMVIRWWIRFGSIKTEDPDYRRARLSAILVSVVALVGLLSVLKR